MNFLTPAEAAKRLRVSPITLRQWSRMGLIQARVTAGGHRRYPVSEIDRLLERHDRPNGTPRKIMIVDDDALLTEILEDFLSHLGMNLAIAVAHNGFDAGRLLVAFKPDIMLLDLKMPGLDGFDVCHQVKSDPTTESTRVIAMTGYPTAENVARILAAGAEVCLPKPVDHAALLAHLHLSVTEQH